MDVARMVYLIDDDAAIRDGLSFLFRSASLRVAPFASVNAFLASIPAGPSGCVVTDVRMPGLSGLDLQRELAARRVDLPVIVLTAFGDVPMAVRAMKSGAFDFVEKPFDPQELLDSVRRALHAGTHRAHSTDVMERLASLTKRERQTLDLILEGEPNKRIAYSLGISDKTVEYHRANVMAKMGARSAAELVRMVLTADAPKGKF